MTTCIIYARVSSEDQVRGFSLEKQKQICYKIAKDLGVKKYQIKYYEEPGISGETITARPQVQKAINSLNSGRIQFAIALDQDRWTRSVADWTGIFTPLFIKHGIRIITSQGEVDLTKRDHRLFSNIKGSISQWHKEYINEICREGIQISRDAGFWCGDIPLGYLFDRNQTIDTPKGRRRFMIVKDPSKAEDVKFILENADRYGHRATANLLGNKWDDSTISRMRRNPIYAGLMRDSSGKLISCLQVKEPYISETRFHEIQALVKNRLPRNYSTAPKYLLTPLLKCGYCGASYCVKVNISGTCGAKWWGYYCQGKRRGKSFCSKSRGHTMYHIDNLVLKNIINTLSDIDSISERIEQFTPDTSAIADLVAERDSLYTKQERLIKAIEDDDFDLALIKQRIRRIQMSIDAIDKKILAQPTQPREINPELFIGAVKSLSDWEPLDKRRYLLEILQKIMIWNSQIKIVYFDGYEEKIKIPPLRKGRIPLSKNT